MNRVHKLWFFAFLFVQLFFILLHVLSLQVNSLLSGHNTNSSNVEKQVTEFVDRLYDMWVNRVSYLH